MESKPTMPQYRLLNKVFELPLMMDAYSEAKKFGNYILPPMDKTVAQITPIMETVTSNFKANVQKLPQDLTTDLTEKYNLAMEKVVDVTGNLDNMACDGLDKLTEQVPLLKEPTAKVLETTKTTSSSWVTEQLAMVQKYINTDFDETMLPGVEALMLQVNALKETIIQRFTSGAKLQQMENIDILATVVDITSKIYDMLAIRAAGLFPGNLTLFTMDQTKNKNNSDDEIPMIRIEGEQDDQTENTNTTHVTTDNEGEKPIGMNEKSSKVNIITKEEFGKMGERKSEISE